MDEKKSKIGILPSDIDKEYFLHGEMVYYGWVLLKDTLYPMVV